MESKVEITSQNLEDNASIIQSQGLSGKPFSEDGEGSIKYGYTYLDEVDRQLVVEVKAKTQEEQEAELAAAAQKSKRDQFNHSKKVYNSTVKSRRNEKSLLKATQVSTKNTDQNIKLLYDGEKNMSTKTNFILEL